MSGGVHTTDEIRDFVAYGDWGTEEYPVEWFNAWLASHDAEVRRQAAEEAWDECREELRTTLTAPDPELSLSVGGQEYLATSIIDVLIDEASNPYREEGQ